MSHFMTALTPSKILGMIDAGLTNVKIAGEVGVTMAAIWRLTNRREVKGK